MLRHYRSILRLFPAALLRVEQENPSCCFAVVSELDCPAMLAQNMAMAAHV